MVEIDSVVGMSIKITITSWVFYTSIKRPVPVPECSDAGQFARYSRIFLKSRCAVQRAGGWEQGSELKMRGWRARVPGPGNTQLHSRNLASPSAAAAT